jgi:hypothetical protein
MPKVLRALPPILAVALLSSLCLLLAGCAPKTYSEAERQAYLSQVAEILDAHQAMLSGSDSNSLLDPAKRKGAQVLMSFDESFKGKYEASALEQRYGFTPLLEKLASKGEAYAMLAVVSGRDTTAELIGDQPTRGQKADQKKSEAALAEYKALLEEARKKLLATGYIPAATSSPGEAGSVAR